LGRFESILKSVEERIPHGVMRYALPAVCLGALLAVTYASWYVLGIRTLLFYGLIYACALIIVLGSAWLGYGPGILISGLVTSTFPQAIRIIPNRGFGSGLFRFGLLLAVSLLVSRMAQKTRRRETSLLRFAEDFEARARQQTEEALRAAAARQEAEDRLRFVLDAAQIGYWDHDVAANSTTRSRKHDEIFGYREPLPHWDPETLLQHVHSDDRAMVEACLAKAMDTGQQYLEFRIVWPDYSVHWVWAQVRAHRDVEGRPIHVSGVIADITERKEAADSLGEQAQLLDLAHDAIITLDWNVTIRFWSRGAKEMYGWTPQEALGKISHELLETAFPEPLVEIKRKLVFDGHWEGELIQTRRDGARIRVASRWALLRGARGEPRGYFEINTDVTEKRRIEEQLQHTQKLESLGVLAGGVAHDFNNLLTGILGNTSLALDRTPQYDPNYPLLEEAITAAERAADLTRQLLAYAGKGRFVTRTIDLSDLVREISGLVQTSVPKGVSLCLQLADQLPGVDADPGQLQQIVMNLVINGAEAVGTEGGTVMVSTGVQQVDEPYIATISPLRPGRYVSLEVHDTGSGMDEATLARIFDPFFTTKFAGRGLGLAAVSGIVRAHKGGLKVDSKPGQGTTFKVLLPASVNPIPGSVPAFSGDLTGTGAVLVVDDEETVRRTAQHTLERYGYQVTTAGDGVVAVEMFSRNPEGFALVLLDLTMPVISGEETLRRLQVADPNVRVLLTSGYNEDEAVERFAGRGLAGFIQKPYTAAALAERVKEALRQQIPDSQY